MQQVIGGIPVFGAPDRRSVEQMKRCSERAEAAALMADHHLGYSMPIGGVAAYDGLVSPSGVGYDIACGNKAVRIDATRADIADRIGAIMDDVVRHISFGIGRTNDEDADHDLFDDPAWKLRPASPLKELARQQLGTVGSGNHYVDIFADEQDRVWVGVHFGSRGLGHKLATHFVREGGGEDGIDVPPVLLAVGSAIGDDYIACMNLAGRYAYAGRDWVCDRVARIIGAPIVESVHNHHNFAWLEEHNGRSLWVVRKGATPAWPGQRGFVGGSMGEESVILEGVDGEESKSTLRSTVHGAGRVMSRTEAAGKWRYRAACEACGWIQGHGVQRPKACPDCGGSVRKRRVQMKAGKVSHEMMREWVDGAGVELRGGGLDESPHAYKRLGDVLDAHAGSVRVIHRMRPLGVAMAGAGEFDPYKD